MIPKCPYKGEPCGCARFCELEEVRAQDEGSSLEERSRRRLLQAKREAEKASRLRKIREREERRAQREKAAKARRARERSSVEARVEAIRERIERRSADVEDPARAEELLRLDQKRAAASAESAALSADPGARRTAKLRAVREVVESRRCLCGRSLPSLSRARCTVCAMGRRAAV